MEYFLLKLIPPRPTFTGDMTRKEGEIMEEHFAYWGRLIAERKVVVYGPVMDPEGSYGIAVVEVENGEAARRIAMSDPAARSHAGFRYEIHPMPNTIVRS